MRNVRHILIVCACFLAGSRAWGQDDASPTETLPDFYSLRNPFVGQLPKIIEPVETQNIQNGMINNPQLNPTPTPQAMQTVIPVKPTPPVLVVQGTVWGSKKPLAIINENVVGIGDKVSGVIVQKITKEGVDVDFNDENIHIKVDQ